MLNRINNLVNNFGNSQAVNDAYVASLGRPAAESEIQWWLSNNSSIADIRSGIAGSPEAQSRASSAAQPAATAAAPLSSPSVAIAPAPTTNATRAQVLAAYANNPLAERSPTEDSINYWMNAGLGSFDSTVNQVRASNPALASSIDASRATTGNAGALSRAATTATATPLYFQQNPDVAAAYASRASSPYWASTANMTPDQFAATHFERYGRNEQRAAPTAAAPVAAPVAATPVAAPTAASPVAVPKSMPANYDQAYVNQLVREAAQQAGGTLSFTDLSNAAKNLGIPVEMVNRAISTGVITGADTSAYEQLVRDAYGSIGRTGMGTEASNIDQAGFDGWVQSLQRGESTPEAFQRNFRTAVADYLVRNPNDQYSTYVTDFLSQNKPAAVSDIVDLYREVLGRDPDAGDQGTIFSAHSDGDWRYDINRGSLIDLPNPIQDLYTEFMGAGRIADREGLRYWDQRFGGEIDASEREEFRQAAAAELSGAFGKDDAGLLSGFKYAKDLGVSNDGLRKTLGDDLYNQYQGQLKNFATTEIDRIVSDNSLTFDESQKVYKFARDLGFDSQQLADLTGKNKFLFDTILTSYDANSRKIINDTLTSPNILTDADRVVAAYALERQFGFTDEELSKATGVDVKTIKDSLNPVRNFEADFSKITSNTDSTTKQIKDFLVNAKSNAAIDKLYGEALTGYENKIAELEQKWSRFGSDPIQSENLSQQLNAQRNAIGGQYYQGVFSDLDYSAARLVQLGLDTVNDLGQKDKFQSTTAVERITTADGQPVIKRGDQYFLHDYGDFAVGAPVDPSPRRSPTASRAACR
jgi:hypothetical protein